jgi:hypothetical protein
VAAVVNLAQLYKALSSGELSRGLLTGNNADFWGAWNQAYRNSYNPAPLPDELEMTAGTFELDSKSFEAVFMGGIDHAARRALMAKAPSYKSLGSDYPGLNIGACALCANLTQIIDAESGASNELNALWYDDDHAWLGNKFPYVRGDSMILPRRHDDLSLRHQVSRSTERGQGIRSIVRRPGATAGAKISPDFLVKAFALADRYKQVAHRNHAIDGMSMPEHDHLKLIPESHPIWSIFIREARAVPNRFCGELDNTPFATLVIKNDPVTLAEQLSNICNHLEDMQVVFTFIYNAGTVFITPRAGPKVDAADVDVWIGNGVSCHVFEHPSVNPDHLRRAKAYTSRKGEFDWRSVTDTNRQ